jgi:RNA polymerase sigma factor (sigma-70 family)
MGEVMSALAVVSRPEDGDAEDLDLVAGVRAGDDRAFEVLYLRYQGRIAAYVRGMVHDRGRAEDVTQEVFMSALRRMRGTDAPIAFKPWIYEIAKNACIDSWRRSRNVNEVSFDAKDALGADDHGRLADPGVTPASAVDNKDAIDNLCGAFGGLSQTHHEILVMREFEGLSYREIGERLGMSRPGVESTLFRARRRLSEEYEELVSGERCRRVQQIVDTSGGRAAGVRDRRRMARHLSHCQPCRRYARLAGVDLGVPARPAAAAAARIAAWCPLPLFLRRRWDGGEQAGQLVAQSHHAPLTQWTASLATSLDPATVSGWSKALATAATVAVASVGAGAAIGEHHGDRGLGAKPAVAASHAGSQGFPRAGGRHGARAVGGAGAHAAKPRPQQARASHRAGRAGRAAAGPGSATMASREAATAATGGADGGAAVDQGGPQLGAVEYVSPGIATAAPQAAAERPAGAGPDAAQAIASLGHVIDALGLGSGTAGAGDGSGAGRTPAPAGSGGVGSPVAGVAGGATGGVSSTFAVTAASASADDDVKPAAAPPASSIPAPATDVIDTVPTIVTGTPDTPPVGPTAP